MNTGPGVFLWGGFRFDDRARRCTVHDNDRAFGVLFLCGGLFAAYILFCRPDIYKEVNALIWLFRVIFPVGFALVGLYLLSRCVRTEFDAVKGTFVYKKMSLFKTVTREGRLGEVARIVLVARLEAGSQPEAAERLRWKWCLTLSMDLAGELVPLRSWERKIAGNRPANEVVVEAQGQAERLARFIERPFVGS
jgi:hypothetical protein